MVDTEVCLPERIMEGSGSVLDQDIVEGPGQAPLMYVINKHVIVPCKDREVER